MTKTKIDMVRVDRTEYEAFKEAAANAERVRVELEGKLETERLRAQHATEHYQQCLAINRDQCARLTTQELQIKALETKVGAYEREIARLQAELVQLRPATLNAGPQPAIGARRSS